MPRHVIVDPFVLQVPTAAQAVTAYVEGLTEWLPALAKRRDECSVSERVVTTLLQMGRFPTHETLRVILGQANEESFSIKDILNLVRVVAESEPFLEQHVGYRSLV